jgi:hypothetical protein
MLIIELIGDAVTVSLFASGTFTAVVHAPEEL